MRFPWLIILVLLSGGAFLAAGLIGLARSAKEASDVARAEADRAAVEQARSIQRALRDPATIALPAEHLFRLEDGRVVVPPGLAWLRPPEIGAGEPSMAVAARLRRADDELLAGDTEAAVAVLEEGHAQLSVGDPSAARLLVAAAWLAHRGGRADRRDETLERLRETGPDPLPDGVALSILLLDAACGREIAGEETARLVCRLPEAKAAAVLERLEEHGAVATSRRLRAAWEPACRQRRRLALVETRQDALARATGPLCEMLPEERLLLYFPRGEGAGHGAVVKARRWLEQSGISTERIVVGETPRGAIPAGPGLSARPMAAGRRPGWTGSGRLGTLLVILASVFSLVLFLTLRAVRREALAARARAEFLTSVTHELKTPLASIRLLAEMLEEGRVPDEARRQDYHRLLSSESARLTMLIENVLDLGRLERGERAYDTKSVPLETVVSEAVELFRPLAARDGMEVSLRQDAGGRHVVADRGAVVQALLNVMENARKYALAGKRLEVATACRGGAFAVTLRDFGPGVDESERDVIFERFRRGGQASGGAVPGVGLGLHLARRILRDHRGDLTVTAPPDGPGACFLARLPIAEETA